MTNQILIALISSLSAISGSIIAFIGNAITSRINEKKKFNIENRETKLKLYSDFIMKLQNYINNSTSENFDQLSECLNEMKLIGGAKVVAVASEYYIRFFNQDIKLDSNSHKIFQEDLINAMREDLSMKKVDKHLSLLANKKNHPV